MEQPYPFCDSTSHKSCSTRHARQIDMFMDAAKQDKVERMEKCVEEIRRRFGKDSIRNGVLCQNLRLPPEKAEITMPTGMVG